MLPEPGILALGGKLEAGGSELMRSKGFNNELISAEWVFLQKTGENNHLEKVQCVIVPGWGDREPTQSLVREVPKPLVSSKIAFPGEAGSEGRSGTASRMLQNAEALPEKQKMGPMGLLQAGCSWHTCAVPAPCFYVVH